MGIPSPAASWGGKRKVHRVTNKLQQRPTFSNGWGQRSDLDVSEPGFDGPEALLHRDVVHHHHAVRLAEELLGDAAVPAAMTASFSTNSDTPALTQVTSFQGFNAPLLASCVPQLHGHLHVVQRQCLHTVINT